VAILLQIVPSGAEGYDSRAASSPSLKFQICDLPAFASRLCRLARHSERSEESLLPLLFAFRRQPTPSNPAPNQINHKMSCPSGNAVPDCPEWGRGVSSTRGEANCGKRRRERLAHPPGRNMNTAREFLTSRIGRLLMVNVGVAFGLFIAYRNGYRGGDLRSLAIGGFLICNLAAVAGLIIGAKTKPSPVPKGMGWIWIPIVLLWLVYILYGLFPAKK
jgi:hypothetical protein